MGRADLVFKVFFPKSENNFKAGFSGFEVGGFLCASPEQKITSFVWHFVPRKAGLKIIF